MTKHPHFPAYQRRMAALGYYNARVDDEWGPKMDAGMTAMLSALEVAGGSVPVGDALPPDRANTVPWTLVPTGYHWLKRYPLSPMLLEALLLYGTVEIAGGANSPTIMQWSSEVGEKAIGYKYVADSVPWCGLFMAVIAKRAGLDLPYAPLYALNWGVFGAKAGQPGVGDVLTFTRAGGGHVALYLGEDSTHYHVIGGNQGDAVSVMRIAKIRLHSARRPAGVIEAHPKRLAGTGAPVSVNEA